MFAPIVPIRVQLILSVERSIWNPVSSVELSVHARFICVDVTAVATRLVGGAGAGWVGVLVKVGVGVVPGGKLNWITSFGRFEGVVAWADSNMA